MVEPFYAAPFHTIAEAKIITEKVIQEFFAKSKTRAANWKSLPLLDLSAEDISPPRILLKSPAGLGKTTTLGKILATQEFCIAWYMAPNLNQAQEAADLFREQGIPTVMVFKGRSKDSCKRHSLIPAIVRLGHKVDSSLCKSGKSECPYFADCPYQSQVTSAEELSEVAECENTPCVYVMVHNYLINSPPLPDPNYVIVDESFWQIFLDKFEIELSDMLLPELRDEEYRTCATEVSALIQRYPLTYLTALKGAGVTGLALKRAQSYIQKNIEDLKIEPAFHNSAIQARINNPHCGKLRRLAIFYRSLAEEMTLRRKRGLIVELKGDTLIIHIRKNISHRLIPHTPILMLDASADRHIVETVTNFHLYETDLRIERNVKVTQMVGKTFSRQSITGVGANGTLREEYNVRDAEILRKGIKKLLLSLPKGTFVAGNKTVIDIFREDNELAQHCEFAHYGALRGSNKFKDCSSGVLLGREQPSPKDIEAMARSIWAFSDNDLELGFSYSNGSRNIRLRSGLTYEEKTPIHPCSFCQLVLEQIREREMEQAADRLRLIHNSEKKRLIILSNIVMDFTADEIIRWKDLRAGGTRLKQAISRVLEKGAFPITKGEMTRVFPDIWLDKDAAAYDLGKHGGIIGVKTQIESYLENSPILFVTYRHKGQRGANCKAYIWVTEANALAALEGVVGVVKNFTILPEMEVNLKEACNE